MSRKRKIIIIAISILFILIILAAVYFSLPRTVLKYSSDDGNIIVTITQPKEFSPVPSRSHDYTLSVKKKGGIFSDVILERDFTLNADGSGIDDSFVDIRWDSNSVFITIDSHEVNGKKTFEAAW